MRFRRGGRMGLLERGEGIAALWSVSCGLRASESLVCSQVMAMIVEKGFDEFDGG